MHASLARPSSRPWAAVKPVFRSSVTLRHASIHSRRRWLRDGSACRAKGAPEEQSLEEPSSDDEDGEVDLMAGILGEEDVAAEDVAALIDDDVLAKLVSGEAGDEDELLAEVEDALLAEELDEEEEEEEETEDEESSEDDERPGPRLSALDDEAADAVAGDEDEDEEGAAARARGLRRGRVLEEEAAAAGRGGQELDLDSIVAAVERGGSMDGAGMEGAAGGWEGEEGEEGAEGARRVFPAPPARRYRLPDLLRAAGLETEAAAAPDVEIDSIATCNSAAAGPGSLYVCVPAEDSSADGHDWADAAASLGVSAVLAEREVEAGAVPVVRVPPPPAGPGTLAALAALADAFYERPSRRLRTVGIVGSYGKTTAAWLARGLFEEGGELVGMVGTVEHALAEERLTEDGEIWEPEEADVTMERNCSTPFHVTPYEGKYGACATTPDALHIQKVLAAAADRGAQTALVECCPGAAADGRLDQVDFDVLVFTNIDRAKAVEAGAEWADEEEEGEEDEQDWEVLEDEAALAAAREAAAAEAAAAAAERGGGGAAAREAAEAAAAEAAAVRAYTERVAAMFDRLTDGERQRAVVNTDDPAGADMARRATEAGAQVVTYGMEDRQADVFAEKVKHTIWETEVLVRTPVGRLQIITPLLGKQSVYSVLAAVGVGLACGVPLKAIVAGIEAVDIIPGRCEIVDERQPFSVVVDYAKTGAEVERLIADLRDVGARRILLVAGAEGTATPHEMAALGAACAKADAVFLTNNNPGASFPEECVAGVVAGLPEEVRGKHTGSLYPWLQDPHRVPHWFQKFMLQYQSEAGIFVIEDRFQAIRVAIGMAKPRDLVVVVGKGHEDWQEYWDGISGDGTLKSWFDDRVECRNALSKLSYLNGLKDLDRSFLPWTRYPEEREHLMVAGLADFELEDD